MRGRRERLKRQLVERNITLEQTAEVRGAMRKMIRKLGAGAERRLTGREAATLLLTAIGVDAAGLEFNEGEVILDDRGREAHVTRSAIDQMFIHRIGGSAPPDFYDVVRTRVLELQDAVETDVEWPNER